MTNEVKEDPCKITDAVKNDTKESKLESEKSKDTPEPSKVSPVKSKLSPKSGDTMSTTDHFGEANQSIDEKIDFESQKLDGVYNQVKNLMTQNGIK